MSEQGIENSINEVLTGEPRKNALGFVAFLKANDMLFVRGKGYWEDKLYWMIKFKDEYVSFILLNSPSAEEKCAPWTIWSDDSVSECLQIIHWTST